MRSIAEKRKEFMKVLTDVTNAIDPTGNVTNDYIKKYSKLSDEEFKETIEKFFNDDSKNFYFEMLEYENDLKYENIKKAAEVINVPLYEKVYLPHINNDPNENIVITPEPVPVGYIHQKRMMQTLEKKNSGSTSINQRNQLTGQVINEDKNARNSDVETYSLLAVDANKALAEFMGPRADDRQAKTKLYASLTNNGYASLEESSSKREDKIAINTLNVYFNMQGFKTNLISGDNLLSSMYPNDDKGIVKDEL